MATRSGTVSRRAFAAIAVAATAFLTAGAPAAETALVPQVGLYELRVYTAADGKLPELDARFRNHTISLFRKHGMKPIAFFHPENAGDNRIIYLMGYKDRAARDAAWNAFAADPEWKSVAGASEANGAIVARVETLFLEPTDYSPALDMTSATPPRYFELRTYTTNPGKLENLHSRFRDHTLRLFEKHGMTNLLYWRPAGGQAGTENQMVYLLAFPDKEARKAAWAAFVADEAWKTVAADSQKDGQILAPSGAIVSVEMTPTDYSPLK
jgi:hypothetical protein